MVVEPEPVVVAEGVAEVALDRPAGRRSPRWPAGGVVGVLHHDHLPGELAPRGPARQQAQRAKFFARCGYSGRPSTRNCAYSGASASTWQPVEVGVREVLAVVDGHSSPGCTPSKRRRSRLRREACRRPHRCRTASVPPCRRCRSASPCPPSPPVDIPSSTTPAGVSPTAAREHQEHATPGIAGGGEIGGGDHAATAVFSSMRLDASSPSAPM